MKTVTRELDDTDVKILELIAKGKTSKQIGYELNLTTKTVANKITVMMVYYGCASRTELCIRLLNAAQDKSLDA